MKYTDIYEFKHYRDYLKKEFPGIGDSRGRRSLLATKLGCQTSFLSQVLTDRAHLSLEHAILTSEFLDHDELEKKYFMLLVQKEKAGSKALESFFERELKEINHQRVDIKERIKVRTDLTDADQMKYYSVWYYSAIHVLCAFSEYNHLKALVDYLKLDVSTVKEALQFLSDRNFILKKDSHYEMGATRIHLKKNSPMLPNHHTNWRMKAIESFAQERPIDLHYSSILGISKKNMGVFRERLLQLLQEFEPVIEKSPVEVPVIFLMDLFQL